MKASSVSYTARIESVLEFVELQPFTTRHWLIWRLSCEVTRESRTRTSTLHRRKAAVSSSQHENSFFVRPFALSSLPALLFWILHLLWGRRRGEKKAGSGLGMSVFAFRGGREGGGVVGTRGRRKSERLMASYFGWVTAFVCFGDRTDRRRRPDLHLSAPYCYIRFLVPHRGISSFLDFVFE